MKNLFLGALLLTSAGAIAQSQNFSNAGTNTFVIPASVTAVKVECVGAGGAGGRVTPSNPLDKDAAGGGGGGAYAAAIIVVNQGNSYDVIVGNGGVNNGASVQGEPSYFDDGTQVYADGGSTRIGNDNETGVQGGQASNSIGSVVFSGGNGGNGDESDANGGGGGGAAGSNGTGFNGGEINGGGSQSNYGGHGGQGGPDGASGTDGGNYGGGGGGSSANGSNDRDGGEGADGLVVLTWCTISNISPQEVCASGSAQINVQGTNFTAIDSVKLNNELLSYSLINTTSITVTLSGNTSTGPIEIFSQNGSARSLDTLQVHNETVAVSISGFNELTANYSGGNANYQWVDCANSNNPITGATNSTEVFSQNGVYAVQVEENGCTITSDCFVFNSVSIEESASVDFIVYPNPGSDLVVIESLQKGNYQIINVAGQIVMEGSLFHPRIDVSALKSGLYFIQFKNAVSNKVKGAVKWVKR